MAETEVEPGPLARTLLYAPDELAVELRLWCMSVEERLELADRLRHVAGALEVETLGH